jgi:hypothetical protein
MIVWLASYPRSGNTMLRLLLDVCFGLRSRDFNPVEPNRQSSIGEYMSWEHFLGEGQAFDSLRDSEQPHLLKTHDRPRDDHHALYIVRDGRDALVSYAHFLRHYEPTAVDGMDFQQVLEGLILGRLGYGSWSAHLEAWSKRPSSAPTGWLRYEDMVASPVESVGAALRAVNLDVSPTGKSPLNFEELHQRWPAFFRRGKVSSWRTEMSHANELLFWENHSEMMARFGYSRAAAV